MNIVECLDQAAECMTELEQLRKKNPGSFYKSGKAHTPDGRNAAVVEKARGRLRALLQRVESLR